MDRGKIIAVITGVISVVLAIAYLVLVSLLDSRGLMQPAPQELSQTNETHAVQVVLLPKARLGMPPASPAWNASSRKSSPIIPPAEPDRAPFLAADYLAV